ncbi:MAG: PQQ-binding-like beta-propeller repeat protein [Bacteroidales bacterium]|nr:PQQ-binding-like beta-propeller repeat protein [Bacteroidales bacterium]
MKQFIVLLSVIFILAAACSKDEPVEYQTDSNGVIILLPYQWKKSLHEDGIFHSNSRVKNAIIYNGNIAIPTTVSEGVRYLTMINPDNGETIWQWNDIYNAPTERIMIDYPYINGNLLTYQEGACSYCINLENGATYWKFRRDKNFDITINSYNSSYFTYSDITNTDGYDEQIAYVGDIQTGDLTEFLSANLSGGYVSPASVNGRVGSINEIIEVLSNNNLLLVCYAEPLPEWCVNSFLGLYNTEIQEWVYERKLMAPPLWNTSVYWPQIYDNKVYASVGNNLVCHDLYTGEQIWRREFNNDFFFSGFIIEEDKIIANNENLTLYCLDLETGYDIWTGEGAGTSSHMSYLNGIVYFVGGSDSRFHAVDIETGQTVWRLDAEKLEGYDGMFKTNAVYVILGENGNKGKIIALTHMYAYCFEAYQ